MPGNDNAPRRGAGRNFLNNAGQAIRRSFNREVQGARNTVPGTQNFQLGQLIDALLIPGNVYNSQAGPGESRWQVPGAGALRNLRGFFGPGQAPPSSPPGAALPGWMAPGAQGPDPANPLALPNYTDPNAWGPPENLAGQAPGLGVQRRPNARRGGLLAGNEMGAPLGIDTPANAYQSPWLRFWDRPRGEK